MDNLVSDIEQDVRLDSDFTLEEYLAFVRSEESFELLPLTSLVEDLKTSNPKDVKELHLEKGQVVCKAGDEQNYVYFIDKGEVLIDNSFVVEAPEMIGEMGAFVQKRTKDVVANTNLDLVAIPSHLFFKSLDNEQRAYLTRRIQGYAVNDLRRSRTDELSRDDLELLKSLTIDNQYEQEVLSLLIDAVVQNGYEDRLRIRNLSPYEIIYREGGITKDAAVILEGDLYVLTGEPTSPDRKIYKRETGSLLGEGASVGRTRKRNGSVIGYNYK